MTDHDRYPTTDEEPGPLDGLVPLLRDADATHEEKAIALAACARREYEFAVEDGQIAGGPAGHDGFIDWAGSILPVLDAVLEAYDGR